jgi:hypothetical protein
MLYQLALGLNSPGSRVCAFQMPSSSQTGRARCSCGSRLLRLAEQQAEGVSRGRSLSMWWPQVTELMSCVRPSANENFAFGMMCFETRRILEKLVWPTWSYVSAMMRITDRPSADRGIGHQQVACCSPITLPARRRRPCHLRDTRFPQPRTRVAIVIRHDPRDSSRLDVCRYGYI